MKKEEKFCLTERILDALDESISLVFLANPNNPVGNLVEPELIFKIAEKCRQCDITLVLDECFMNCRKAGCRSPTRKPTPKSVRRFSLRATKRAETTEGQEQKRHGKRSDSF